MAFDPAQLTEAQQEALGTYTAVTNQEASAAVPLLRRSEWNVQVRHSKARWRSLLIYERLPLQNSSMVKHQILLKKLEQLKPLHLYLRPARKLFSMGSPHLPDPLYDSQLLE